MRFDGSTGIEDTRAVRVTRGELALHGDLGVPAGAAGVVLFAHGSGSGRKSPRNQLVASQLRRRGLATLLLDLLTEQEERDDMYTARWRFDIPLLAERLDLAAGWLAEQPATRGLPLGLFGASTGAAAALICAAVRPEVAAVVSRGGRPDLAGSDALDRVNAPVLLIVGELDEVVIDLNQHALAHLVHADAKIEIVPGATHLFEEPGALEIVAGLAGDWFDRWLRGGARKTRDKAA